MNTRYFALLVVMTFGLLSGCYADWNQFERGMNTSFVEDSRFSDLECDASGCYLCEHGTCTQYSCDTTNQCPQGYVCTIDQQCLPGVNAPVNPAETSPSAEECSDHSQ